MALIPEDGTGLPDADSYESLAEFKAYADAHGFDYTTPAYSDAAIEAAMRRATAWLDATYRTRYTGDVRFPATQALEWPRTGATWRDVALADDVIPLALRRAQSEAAWRELVSPGVLSPDYVATSIVTREKVGPLEVQYAASSATSASDIAPDVGVIDGLLAPLLDLSWAGPAIAVV